MPAADHRRDQQVAGEATRTHRLGHARGQPALGVDLDGVDQLAARRRHLVDLGLGADVAASGAEPDRDPLGPIALVNRHQLAGDQQGALGAGRHRAAALGVQPQIADLDHELVGDRVGDLATDLQLLRGARGRGLARATS